MSKIVKTVRTAYYRALGYYPANIHGLKFKLDPYHVYYWRSVAKGRWEPQTYTIISEFLNADSVYCDVGAWIGPTVVYAARICKQVICFEPDPTAYRYLRWNIELNKLHNVTSFNIALSEQTAIQRMSSFGGNIGDSMTSLLNNGHDNPGIDVLTLAWDAFMAFSKTDRIDFLKIDIEGGEFALLPTLKDYLTYHSPIVYLSTHAPFLDVDLRCEKMQQIVDIMGNYKKCLNDNLRPIDIREIGSEDGTNNFRSYIFMD